MEKDSWGEVQGHKYSFFQHKECEYFPCHETQHPEDFNCLFCYCPLYALGEKCGGNCVYGPGDIKDCSNCLVPHGRNSINYITSRFMDLADLASANKLDKSDPET